jgi:hypothetical protein
VQWARTDHGDAVELLHGLSRALCASSSRSP